MVTPTDSERESAATRARLAAAGDAERQRAIESCGPGAIDYAKWVLQDKSGREPDRVAYCCRRPEHVGWKPSMSFPGDDERWEEHPGYDFNGANLKPFRWSLRFQFLAEYRPQTAEQLAAAREKREQKAAAAEAEEAARLEAMPKQLTLF